MQFIAHSNFVRYAPRKVNQILRLIKNKPVVESMKILKFVPKRASIMIAKTVKSAAANAGDRFAKDPNLYIEAAWVGQGPTLKRMRAFAMGRGSTYKRKTCHLTVVVAHKKKAATSVA